MIRPILPPVMPVAPLAEKFDAAGIIFSAVSCMALLGIFTFAMWIILKNSRKELGEPKMPAALLCFAGVGLVLLLLHGMTLTSVKGLILCMILMWAGISDMAKHEVPDFISAMILILAFVEFTPANLPSMLIGAAVIFLPQLLLSVLRPGRAVGGADMKISAALGFLLGAEKGLFAVITGLLAAVIVMLIVRRIRKESNKEPFALVPFLTLGAIIAYIM